MIPEQRHSASMVRCAFLERIAQVCLITFLAVWGLAGPGVALTRADAGIQIGYSTNSGAILFLRGAAAHRLLVQSASNLLDWVSIATNALDGTGSYAFSDA